MNKTTTQETQSTNPAEKFKSPQAVSDAMLAFPADVLEMMPAYEDIPKRFKSSSDPFVRVQRDWFFSGLPNGFPLKPVDGVDLNEAIRHLSVIQGSFQPKHEHKQAGVAYLMSLWFRKPKKA